MQKFFLSPCRALALTFALFFCLFPVTASAAGPGISLDVAYGEGEAVATDLSFRYTFNPWLEGGTFQLSPFLEASAFVWAGSDDTLGGGSASFGFLLDADLAACWRPFFSASFGPALITDKSFEEYELGGHLQFKTRASLGVNFGQDFRHRLSVDYTHYSNAGMHDKNDGYNTFGLSYAFRF